MNTVYRKVSQAKVGALPATTEESIEYTGKVITVKCNVDHTVCKEVNTALAPVPNDFI
jgi:hypothetical protein